MRHCFVLGLCLCLLAGAISAQERHVLLLAGQSNMKPLASRINSITEEMKLLLPDSTFVHAISSQGGQPIKQWTKKWNEFCSQNNIPAIPKAYKRPVHEQGTGELYTKLIEKARPLFTETPSSVTFVWLQGETDAWYDDWSPHYEKLLTYLITNLRTDLAYPKMNVVICRISDANKGKHWDVIRTAQMNVVAADSRATWADSDDLNGEKNEVHYPKEGYDKLALRVARQASALIKSEVPAKNGRPE